MVACNVSLSANCQGSTQLSMAIYICMYKGESPVGCVLKRSAFYILCTNPQNMTVHASGECMYEYQQIATPLYGLKERISEGRCCDNRSLQYKIGQWTTTPTTCVG